MPSTIIEAGMEDANIELLSRFETIDFESGELVNVLDSSVPVQHRLDSAKWLIERLNSEIELCKERKKLWNERENVLKTGIERIRDKIKEDMIAEGKDAIKTLENTAYLNDREILDYDHDAIIPEYKVYEVKTDKLNYAKYLALYELLKSMDIVYTTIDSVELSKLPVDLVMRTKSRSLTIRSSPKSMRN